VQNFFARVFVGGFMISALFIVGCGKTAGGGGFSGRKSSGTENTFRYALATNPTTLDPAKVQDIETIDLLSNIYEPLVSYDESNKMVGVLAESWSVSADGLKVSFKLKDTKFHDGSPVTSKDVKVSFERALCKEIASPTAATYLDDIKGYKTFQDGKAKDLEGFEVIDDKNFVITLDAARPYFLGKLTYPCAFIVPAKQGQVEISKNDQVVGTGPFKLKSFTPEQVVTLAANETFHDGKPGVALIERKIVKDAATRLNMIRNGESDYATLEKQDWKAAQTDSKLKDQFSFVKRPAIFYLLLSAKAYAPFKDRNVRRAFMMAIDRERIATEILSGLPVAKRWLPDDIIPGSPDVEALAFNVQAARAELAKSPLNGKLPPLELTIRAENADARYAADAIADDLKKNLSVVVKPRSLEWGAMLKARNRGELQCAYLSWYGDYLDPQNFLSLLLTSTASANYDKWSSTAFDSLCKRADTESNAETRMTLYREAEAIVQEEVPRIPLYHGVDGVITSPRIKGIRKNLLGTMPHSKVTIQ
jgi:oligopeptide transport system substrate-binding protein